MLSLGLLSMNLYWSRLRFCLLAVLLAALAVCLFMPGLGGDFIFDDTPNIVGNTVLHVGHLSVKNLLYAAYSFQPGHGSRSLSMLSFALDYWRGGLDPQVFKTTNLWIHGFTMLVLALMLRNLLVAAQWPERRAAGGALIMALLWAIHPLQISSVLYVVQRMQTLSTLFLVLGLWAYLAMRKAQLLGLPSRLQGILTILCWVLGFAAKEDALLLPLYTWVLELTVLRFRAARPSLASGLWQGYGWLAGTGVAVYLLLIVPYFWSWQAYPGRDFNSWERLLSQGRALAMYLGQIVWPLPGRLSFYYDDFQVSRSLWLPMSTFPAWGLVFILLAWAWRWRGCRPAFSFGVILFFAGHFMTSNVLNLELAFEHRNHFPLIGAVMALCDLGVVVWQHWRLPRLAGIALLVLVIIGLGGGAVMRAKDWGDPMRFASAAVSSNPRSGRAWMDLARFHAGRSGLVPGSSELAKAIDVSQTGVRLTGSVPLQANVVIYKTIKGNVSEADWNEYLERLKRAPMHVQNRLSVSVLLNNVELGTGLDKERVGEVAEIACGKDGFQFYEYLRFGAYIYSETDSPDKGLPCFHRAMELAPADDPNVAKMLADLKSIGRGDWAQQLERLRTQ